MSPWHDIRVPEDNLGGNVLLRITSSKAGQIHVGLLVLCSDKLWIFPGMEISQLFQQANLLQCWTKYHSPEMTTTKVVHSQKFSSHALVQSPVLRIQPTASSHRTHEDQMPGGWHLSATTKQISQVGEEEDAPDGADPEQGLCVSHWQRGSVFGSHTETFPYSQHHQQISGCLKFPVPLPAFRADPSLSREWKANGHYYKLSRRKVGVLPRVQGKPALVTPITSPAHLPRIYGRI